MEKFRTMWVPCDEASYLAVADRNLRTYYFSEPDGYHLILNGLAGAVSMIEYTYRNALTRDIFKRNWFIAAP